MVAGCSISVEGIQVLGPGNLMISEVLVQHSSVYACAFEHVFSNLEPATVYSIHVRAYSAEGASQDSASSHASSMGGTPAALGFPTKALNVTSVQASWELPLQLGSIQGFNLFHRKLPAARFEGPLLLASTVSSFLYTDLGEALSEIQLQAFSGHGDGKHSSHVVSRHMCPWPPPESEAGRSCSQDESSSPPGVVVGIHVGLAALIICLLCLLLGWRHR
ncbi:hypothetical protein G4228_013273 [Cervus hanglu yarkandensis]|nr:hypothetical protein G4228_013273 [Cervus hanglu yarkandensis]